MLRSLTAPLPHTLTTTQRLHINWQTIPLSEGLASAPNPQEKYQETFLFKEDWQQMWNYCCHNWFWDVCLLSQPSLSAWPSPDQVSASCNELLLGNVEEFGVWPWNGSLCANPYHRFLQIFGAVHISIKTLKPYQGDITKTTLISCFSK